MTRRWRLFSRRRRVPFWYAPAYRLPIPSLEALSGQEPRRADLVAWYLDDAGLCRPRDVRAPARASYADLRRVHHADYLESLSRPDALAEIFAVSPGEIVVDEVMHTLRLAVGGTIAAARCARDRGGAAFNAMGGFHHAGPGKGGGLCALDDVAIAIAALRAEGLRGPIGVLDLDAHPPDGLAACLVDDPAVHLASISGSDWGPLPGRVDEVYLPGADDRAYLAALDGLLRRTPPVELCFVLAGGDVLAGDRMGQLAMTLGGARARDLAVADWLGDTPSVWLPAGGYNEHSWKVLAGSYLAVAHRSDRPIPDLDPMLRRFASVARELDPDALHGEREGQLDAEVEAQLRNRPVERPRLLGYYSAEGIEYALARYGLYEHLHRLGYEDLTITIEPPEEVGQRIEVHGRAEGRRHLLIDLIVARDTVDGVPSLLVHWLSLRNPRAAFADGRAALPGQEVPGLGLARDMGQLLGRMAAPLGLEQVVFRPAYLHTAYAARAHFRFADEARQARFARLLHDLRAHPLPAITRALAEGRVRLDGAPYAWEPDLMVYRPDAPPPSLVVDDGAPRFTIAP